VIHLELVQLESISGEVIRLVFGVDIDIDVDMSAQMTDGGKFGNGFGSIIVGAELVVRMRIGRSRVCDFTVNE